MSAMSNYLEQALLNHVLRNVAMTSPTIVYAALFTDDPTDADVGTEVSGGGYARVAVTFAAPAAGVVTNNYFAYAPASADWGVISHVALYDAATGGNMLYHAALSSAELVSNGDTFAMALGDLTVTME